MDARMEFLNWQLDSIGCGTPLLGGLLLLGGNQNERIQGGAPLIFVSAALSKVTPQILVHAVGEDAAGLSVCMHVVLCGHLSMRATCRLFLRFPVVA